VEIVLYLFIYKFMTRILEKRTRRRRRKCKPRDKIGGLCYLQHLMFHHNLKQVTHMTFYPLGNYQIWILIKMP